MTLETGKDYVLVIGEIPYLCRISDEDEEGYHAFCYCKYAGDAEIEIKATVYVFKAHIAMIYVSTVEE